MSIVVVVGVPFNWLHCASVFAFTFALFHCALEKELQWECQLELEWELELVSCAVTFRSFSPTGNLWLLQIAEEEEEERAKERQRETSICQSYLQSDRMYSVSFALAQATSAAAAAVVATVVVVAAFDVVVILLLSKVSIKAQGNNNKKHKTSLY